MWKTLIENIPKRRWNTAQHVPPCLPKRTGAEHLIETNRERFREHFERHVERLAFHMKKKGNFRTTEAAKLLGLTDTSARIVLTRMADEKKLNKVKGRYGHWFWTFNMEKENETTRQA